MTKRKQSSEQGETAVEPQQHRLIFNATEKGGVGKSYVCTQLVEWFRKHPLSPKFQVFDPDTVNRTLSRFHPEECGVLDVETDPTALDSTMQVFQNDIDVSLVDGVGAHYERVFLRWANEVNLFNIARELSVRVTYILIIDESLETVEQGGRLMDQTGDLVDWIIVKNYKQSENLPLWDNSRQRRVALEQLNAKEIKLTKLMEHLAHYATRHSVPLVRALESPDANIFDRQRYRTAWETMCKEFDAAQAYLLPPSWCSRLNEVPQTP